MIDTLFDRQLAKKFNKVASIYAKADKKGRDCSKEFMDKMDKNTLKEIFDKIEKYGHPKEINASKIIREKYESEIDLDFLDIYTLDSLYKSNYTQFSNKDDYDE